MYFLSDCRESDGGCGCCYESRESIAVIDRAVWVAFEAAAEDGCGGLVGATVSIGHRGGMYAGARGSIEAGVAGSCGT
jgi:hypothetical protein